MNQKTASAPAAENKMGTMPIGRLLFNMSLPMMVSMLVQALYNIVDSIFVAKLSENALTAVSLAFPLQMLHYLPQQQYKAKESHCCYLLFLLYP